MIIILASSSSRKRYYRVYNNNIIHKHTHTSIQERTNTTIGKYYSESTAV